MMQEKKNNILYFNNDDEFEEFALGPVTVGVKIDKNGNEELYMTRKFTSQYNDAIKKGHKFCIRDLNSHVNKDGLLGTRYGSYKISKKNIEKYWGDDQYC